MSEDPRRTRNKARIWGTVQIHPGCTRRDVAASTGLSDQTVRQHLRELVGDGNVSDDVMHGERCIRYWAERAL